MAADAETQAANAAAASSAAEPKAEAEAAAAGEDSDFIAAPSFAGPREGFTFSTRDGRTGYFRDAECFCQRELVVVSNCMRSRIVISKRLHPQCNDTMELIRNAFKKIIYGNR